MVLVLAFSLVPMEKQTTLAFLVSGALVILGLGLCLLGTEIGPAPMGERVGSVLWRCYPYMVNKGYADDAMLVLVDSGQTGAVQEAVRKNPCLAEPGASIAFCMDVKRLMTFGVERS
ncbi:MAG: hypothetical protein CVV52_07175 [Spirochaetae bacterium HGW-Spirochaetae-8]|jgi:hypothetical protein|nr:MAG: hypothetical protein CVV52_07175 [Spirochaetae bacterium HGW-Spirochaetae-8]